MKIFFISCLLSSALSMERKLQSLKLGGYEPVTSVADYAALDLDQEEMEKQMSLGNFDNAELVWGGGGHSKRAAWVLLTGLSQAAELKAGAKVIGPRKYVGGETPATADSEVIGYIEEDYSWDADKGTTHIEVYYDAEEVPTTCLVGDMYAYAGATLDGCFNDTGALRIINPGDKESEALSFSYQYNSGIREDNYNERTLQRLSTEAGANMRACDNCDYFPTFQKFYDTYGESDFANIFVSAAFDKVQTNFDSNQFQVDFSDIKFSKVARAEAIRIGSVYLGVWMWAIRELEVAVSGCKGDCKLGEESCSFSPVHAWDEAAAYYFGSIETDDDVGIFPYGWAERSCVDFKTCGLLGNTADPSDTAYANHNILRQLKLGQSALVRNQCDEAEMAKNEIIKQMQVPLIQAFLRQLYLRKYGGLADDLKSQAEVAAYAAAVIPLVRACNEKDARRIYKNAKIGTSIEDLNFMEVKLSLESNYKCMDLTCEEIGGLWAVDEYLEFALPCGFSGNKKPVGSPSSGGGSSGSPGLVVPFVLVITLGAMLAFFIVRRRKKRAGRRPQLRNIAAVAEIA